MGLGLLAAGGLAGLGQAGMAASSMVLKSELDKEERDWLQQRAEQMQIAREDRKVAADNTARTDTMRRIGEAKNGLLNNAIGQKYAGSDAAVSAANAGETDEPLSKEQLDVIEQSKGIDRSRLANQRGVDAAAAMNAGEYDLAVKLKGIDQRDESAEENRRLRETIAQGNLEARNRDLYRKEQYTDWRTSGQPGGTRGGGAGGSSRSGSGGSSPKEPKPVDMEKIEKRANVAADSWFKNAPTDADPGERANYEGQAVTILALNPDANASKAMSVVHGVATGKIQSVSRGDIIQTESGPVLVSSQVADGLRISKPAPISSAEDGVKYLSSLITDGEFMGELAKKDSDFVHRMAASGKLAALSKQTGISAKEIADVLDSGVRKYLDADMPSQDAYVPDAPATPAERKPERRITPDTGSSWSAGRSSAMGAAQASVSPYRDAGVALPKRTPLGSADESIAAIWDIINGAKNKEALGLLNSYPRRDAVRSGNQAQN